MILKAHLERRQGVTLYLIEEGTEPLKVGYFGCSGYDARALLCALQLLCQSGGMHYKDNKNMWRFEKHQLQIEGEKELLEWINQSK